MMRKRRRGEENRRGRVMNDWRVTVVAREVEFELSAEDSREEKER